MIRIKEIELDVQDIRILAAAYRDVAEGYAALGYTAPQCFYDSALSLLKFINMESIDFKILGNKIESTTS